MNVKSALLRVVYHSDRYAVDTTSRINALMYLVSESIDIDCSFDKKESQSSIRLESEKVEEAIDGLESHRLIETEVEQTIGGDERVTYLLTEKGVSKADMLIGGSEEEDIIESVVSEYGDYPISNLLNDIKESEPANEWV